MKNIVKKYLTCSILLIFLLVGCQSETSHNHTFNEKYACMDRTCTECGEVVKAT